MSSVAEPAAPLPRASNKLNTKLCPYPTFLADTTLDEIVAGNLVYSDRIWNVLLDYQKRLLNATTMRLQQEVLGPLNSIFRNSPDERASALELALSCIHSFAAMCSDVLVCVYTQLSELCHHLSDFKGASRYSTYASLLSATSQGLAEEARHEPADGPLTDTPLSESSLRAIGCAETATALTTLPADLHGKNHLSESVSQSVPGTATRPTGAELINPSDVDIPAYRLDLITRIIDRLLSGDAEVTSELWTHFLRYQKRLALTFINNYNVNLLKRIEVAGHPEDEKAKRHRQLVIRLERTATAYLGGLRISLTQLISKLANSGRPIPASSYINSLLRLDSTGFLDDQSIAKLLAAILQADDINTYEQLISGETDRGTLILAQLKKLSESATWVRTADDFFGASPFDAESFRQFYEHIGADFTLSPGTLHRGLAINLRLVFQKLRRYQHRLQHDKKAAKELSLGLLHLARILVTDKNNPSASLRFEDCFNFHSVVDLNQHLLESPEILQECRAVVRRARVIGDELLTNSTYAKTLDRKPTTYIYFHSRLGEICRAHLSYRCVPPSDAGEILELAVASFRRCLKIGSHLNQKHIIYIYPRLAECLSRLGRHSEAAAIFKTLLANRNLSVDAQWRTYKNIAFCLQMLAQARGEGNSNDLSDKYHEEAEGWLLAAARVFEPGVDLRVHLCKDLRNWSLHGQLAWLYFERGMFVKSEQQATRAFICLNSDQSLLVHKKHFSLIKYILGVSLAKQNKNDRAIDILKSLVNAHPEAALKVSSLQALKSLYVAAGDEVGARGVDVQLSEIGDINVGEDKPLYADSHEFTSAYNAGLTGQPENIFASLEEMKDYVSWCKGLLEAGEVRTLVNELPSLIEASRFITTSGRPDSLLLNILANAYLEIGDYKAAERAIDEALTANPNPKNVGMCLLMKGEISLRKREYREAAELFERAIEYGKHPSVLFMAARARTATREYEKALNHLETLYTSGNDKSPSKTATELARLLWKRYGDAEWEGCGVDEDVVRACELLRGAILGKFGYLGDRYAVNLLIRMIPHPAAKLTINRLLRRAPLTVRLTIIRVLEYKGIYDETLVFSAISVIPKEDESGQGGEHLHTTYKAVSRYIMAGWVAAYTTYTREQVSAFITNTINALLKRTHNMWFWSGLFAGNKHAMSDYIKGHIIQELYSILSSFPAGNPEELSDYLREVVFPRLNTYLETNLLGLMQPAYTARESSFALLNELKQVVESWRLLAPFGDRVSDYISVDGADCPYSVTDFQREIAVSILSKLIESISFDADTWRHLKTVTLRLEQTGDRVLVKLRLLHDCAQADDVYQAFGRSIQESPLLSKFVEATAGILPAPVNVVLRKERRDAVATIPLWRSSAPDEGWKWRAFYSYVVEETYGGLKLSYYYLKAYKIFQEAATLEAHELRDYALTQLDGLFVQTYKSSRNLLASVPHTIKNTLKHLPTTGAEGSSNMNRTAVELQGLYKSLLKAVSVVMREFDLRQTIEEVLSEARFFYPHVSFEFHYADLGEAIITGSRGHIITAIWDIIHNAIDAIGALPAGSPRRIRVLLARSADGVEVVLSNTGARFVSASDGFGIGSKNIEYVIHDLHGGRVSNGHVNYGDGFTYEWRLFISLAPVRKRRRHHAVAH